MRGRARAEVRAGAKVGARARVGSWATVRARVGFRASARARARVRDRADHLVGRMSRRHRHLARVRDRVKS